MNDFIVLLIAYVYVIGVLLVGELFRRAFKKSSEFTRKVIHVFAGFSVYTVLFFDHPYVACIVALTFVVLLYLAGPSSPVAALREMFSTMEREEEGQKLWGPFYYGISILTLTLIFTLTDPLLYWIAAAPLTIMYLGDGLASVMGKKYGKKVYFVVGGSKRTIVGSLTLFGVGFFGSMFAMWFNGIFATQINYGLIILTWDRIILLSLAAAGIATIIEFFSPAGLDNLTLPLITCPPLYLLSIVI